MRFTQKAVLYSQEENVELRTEVVLVIYTVIDPK